MTDDLQERAKMAMELHKHAEEAKASIDRQLTQRLEAMGFTLERVLTYELREKDK